MQGWRAGRIVPLVLLLFCALLVSLLVALPRGQPPAQAATRLLFGPRTFTLTASTPQTFSTFVRAISGPAFLHVQNGLPDGSARLEHARITLNGVEVVSPRDFGSHVALIDTPVSLTWWNLLRVTLTGPVGASLTVTLERRDTTLVSVTPAEGRQGETLTVTVVGSNTQFLPDSTRLFAGPGVSVGGAPAGTFGPVTVQDATTLTATLRIDATTILGPRTLVVETDGGRAALVKGFTVLTGSPAIPGTTVSTLAGTGTPGRTDGPGASAQFRLPFDVAATLDGGGLVADTGNSALRQVQGDGTVSTFPVTLLLPTGVTQDSTGRSIVADTGRCVIRIRAPDGTVTTIGSPGRCGFADGDATTARFRFPRDVTMDGAGNIYVADTGNFRVRQIAPDGTVTTLAGTGAFGNTDGPAATATFGLLTGIAVAPDGRVFVSDAVFHRLRQVAPDGTVSPLAGTGVPGFAAGLALQAQFAFPTGLSRDAIGNLYIADTLNQVIRRLTPASQVETVAGTGAIGSQDGPGDQATFKLPFGLGAAPGQVLIADTFNHLIRLVQVGPEITGLNPTSGIQGDTLTLTVTGTNLTGATALTFLLNGVADPNLTATNLTVDATGTQLTATVSIAPTAALGDRVVTVTTPSGTSSSTPSAANTFTVVGKITLTPAAQTLKVNGTGALTVTLSGPAGPGGVSVTLESAAPTIATVTSPVDIPAGLTTATVTVTAGVAPGITNLLATAPGYLSGTAAVEVVANRPPVLNPIGNQTAPLGQTLSFTLTASDPDGDPRTFGVSPVPLPANMTFDSQTGLFTFTPAADQVGTFTLTFSVTDGTATVSETIAITVPAPPPAGVTAFSGQVLDGNDFANGITTPVVGATIAFLGTGQSALTDAQGFFTATGLAPGPQVLDINPATANLAPDGSTYAGFREAVDLIANVTAVIDRPFFLPRIDAASLTTVNPAATTVVTNPNLGVTLTIPPNTAKNPDGTNFTGQLSISLVPRGLAPVALPPELDPGLLITIQPVGVTFATPIPITFPNVDLAPTGNDFNLWSLIPGEGRFAIVGTGRVSTDGQRIETVSGGIRAADWHNFLPPTVAPNDLANNASNRSPQQCTVCPVGSSATVHDGGLMVEHSLPSVRSLGVARSLGLVYSSTTADVRPIIPLNAFLSIRAAVPQSFSAALTVGGVAQGSPVFFDTRTLPESADSRSRLSLQFDGSNLPSSRYPYTAQVFSNYVRSSIGTRAAGQVLIVNRRTSPLGAGWGIQGLQRLHPNSDGTFLLTDGDGSGLVFGSGAAALTGQTFNAPWGLAVAPDGTAFLSENPGSTTFDRILRIAPDGTVSTFDTAATGISNPADVALDAAGNLYVSNNGNSLLFKYLNADPAQRQTFVAFPNNIRQPLGLAFDQAQNLYIVNNSSAPSGPPPENSVTRVPAGERNPVLFAGPFPDPLDIAINDLDEIYVTSFSDGTVYRVTQDGEFFPFVQGLSFPLGIAVDAARNLYVADAGEGTILKVSPDGVREIIASGVGSARSLEIDNDGNLLVPDAGTGKISRILLQPGTSDTFAGPPGDFSRLVKNLDGSFTRTLKDGTRIEFNAEGLQTAVVDRNGNTTSYAYDTSGRLTSITDPVGQVTALAYDAAGLLQAITDPANRVTSFTHDVDGNLTQVTNSDGTTVSYTYDAEHRLLTKTDERGNGTTYTYDFAGRLASVAQPTGEVRQVQPSETQGLANVAAGQGTAATPAPITLLQTVQAGFTDGNGNATAMTVNRFGAITQQTDPLGRVTQISRDANNLPTQLTRPNGSVVTMTYDGRGNLLTTTEQAIGATTSFTYEPTFNQVTSIRDPRGSTTTITYDAKGNPTRITDALGNATALAYDLRGLLTSVTDALGNVTSFAYDLKGNLTSTTDPLGNTTILSYDAAGNVISSTDALGRGTAFAYDPINRLTAVTDATGGITRYGYDPKGNLISVTDAKGQITTFAYNGVDQLIGTTNPLGQAKTFSYDLARNLSLVVDAKGQRIEFTYDAGNQLVQKVLKDPVGTTTDTVTFGYDTLGNLATATDNDSGLTFTYDPVGRLSQAQTAATVAQPATTVSYSYDANGNRLSMTDPQGGVTSYVYDALNRLTSLASPQGTTTFGYDALSRRTALNLPNGSQATYTYDAASQLTELLNSIGTTTISRFAYAYDAVGNRITRTATNGIANYTYDVLNRLTQATQPNPIDPLQQVTESFTYDPVGNRASSHLATGQLHDAANRLLEDTNATYSYDANGNLIEQISKASGDRTVYTYNVENQLIQAEKFTVVGGLSPVLSALYRYDAFGRRIQKNVDGVITRYIYDQEDILLELDGTNQVVARYTHGWRIDEPLIMARSGQSFFYHVDGLGSVWDITDAAGTVARSYTYDSFGQLIAQTGTVPNPYTYTSREFDAETGLYHYRARALDSSTGRFLTVDPIIDPGILSLNPAVFSVRQLPAVSPLKHNAYSYVEMNPVTFVDPFGLASCPALPETCPGGIWSGGGFETGFQLGVLGIRRSGVTLRCWGNPDLTAELDITCGVIGGGLSADFSAVGLYCFGGQTKAELSGLSEGFVGGGGKGIFGTGGGLTGSKTGATCVSIATGIGAGAFGGVTTCETTVQ